MAWSRLAIIRPSSGQRTPWGRSVVSSSVMSDAYVTMQACSTGSSGRRPSARSQTCWNGGAGSARSIRRAVDVAQVDGAGTVVALAERVLVRLHAGPEVGKRRRDSGTPSRHRDLVVEPVLVHVEARLQVEDRLAVLDRDDASGGERLAVADAVDLVEDRRVSGRRVAGSTRGASGRSAAARPRDRGRQCERQRRVLVRRPVHRTRAGASRRVSALGRC